ncbi:LOW QUALITY PROTEIN: aldehyde oxidase GLOX-like [Dioscorea cayenensis subsp. rotundata]|uniref:LOW QUALITY PROTEIN: aldehyde oxidase GLOX-like n=1 Tax=Dioscorea cayennensis subsp. rotundata TaxID=55577 RepID=A0AB40C601_DIOCR|nr:LOW QUALITY PROTEIN: aldehyde oxidase GLOX-like [Dioscorea cayenensis subsp. rotundata]
MKVIKTPHHHLLTIIIIIIFLSLTVARGGDGWQLLQRSTGVSAMHMQLLHNDRVIIFDRTDFGKSNISLPDGRCRHNDHVIKVDCTAHSVEFDVAGNTIRPLMILTDTWCSSGTVHPDGHLVQTGGFSNSDSTVRTIEPCKDKSCDWSETPHSLAVGRWYSTNQILPDGGAIIVGGRKQFNYEFYPKTNGAAGAIPLQFLLETTDAYSENNLYPFVHLNIDGNLFIFANNRAILLNYKDNKVVRTYPAMPGGHPRNYPSSGSSVLLPLKLPHPTEAEVLVCGGAPKLSFNKAKYYGTFVEALNSCGRIRITDESPSWAMETMPTARTMGDMLLLPNGLEVLIVNGAALGTAGWEYGRDPVLTPVVYRHYNSPGSRFSVHGAAARPRLYHSTAVLLRDGRVLAGGSNPHVYYNFSGVEYPTDLSLEAYSPEYLSSEYSKLRPKIISPTTMDLKYGNLMKLRFSVGELSNNIGGVAVTMVAPAFATHSFSMNQRLLFLDCGKPAVMDGNYEIQAVAPESGVLAPPGYYMVFLVNGGIPSEGMWVHIQ